MKIDYFDSADFDKLDEIKLSEWVFNGEHYPTVLAYYNTKTKESFQVSVKHKKFRRTPAGDGFLNFGKWEDLE